MLNQVFEYHGNFAEMQNHTLFYDWEVAPICRSNPAEIRCDITGIVPPPSLPLSLIKIGCNDSAVAIASGTRSINWYNDRDILVFTGDTFPLPPLVENALYYVRNESGIRLRGGATSYGIGQGGFVSNDQYFMSFDVHSRVRIHSVQVYAGSAGKRKFVCRDDWGTIIRSTEVQVPAGLSRVSLDFDLPQG
ncbi:MAG: hypothetical protein R3B47_13435 [Bacteroidia bacterium]